MYTRTDQQRERMYPRTDSMWEQSYDRVREEEDTTVFKDSVQIRTKNYFLSANLTDQRLKITLKDATTSSIYQKQYTESDVGEQIQHPMTLEDVLISIKCSVQTNNQHENFDYQNEKEHIKYYKVQKKGRLIVYMNLKDSRTNKQRKFQSALSLTFNRKMVEAQLVEYKMKCQILKLQEQLRRQKMKSKTQKEKLTKKLQQTQQKLDQCLEKIKKLQIKLEEKEKEKEQKQQQVRKTEKISKKIQQPEKNMKKQQEKEDSILEIISDLSPKNLQKIDKQSSAIWDIQVYPTHTTSSAKIFNNQYRCSIGRAGPSAFTRQGDDTTPIGTFPLRQIWYRPDRTTKQIYDLLVQTGLPVRPITVNDGWCDEPKSPYYNKHVDLRTFDKSVSHQNLWLESSSYDCLIVMGFNDDPVIPYRGSAIFIHVARLNYPGTAGCVAFSKDDLWQIMKYLKPYSQITVYDYQDKAKGK